MRHIDLDAINLPDEWHSKAQNALEVARAAIASERANVVNARSSVWSELKPALAALSHDKCWYCESLQIRSYNDVDHFRPKNRVAECEEHEGYWWLAFVWRNYRFSCTLCNRPLRAEDNSVGGKRDFFPLVHEGARAMREGDDISREEPLILDPTDPGDPGLLWFNAEGYAVEKLGKEGHPLHYRRAQESIRLYHLNHRGLTDRRKLLFRELQDLVNEGTAHILDQTGGNLAANRGFRKVAKDLHRKISPQSEYSAVAKAMLIALRDSDHPWIEGVLTSA